MYQVAIGWRWGIDSPLVRPPRCIWACFTQKQAGPGTSNDACFCSATWVSIWTGPVLHGMHVPFHVVSVSLEAWSRLEHDPPEALEAYFGPEEKNKQPAAMLAQIKGKGTGRSHGNGTSFGLSAEWDIRNRLSIKPTPRRRWSVRLADHSADMTPPANRVDWIHVHLTSILFLRWCQQNPEHAHLAQCPEWVSLPRRACLEAICFEATGDFHDNWNRSFFSRHVQSSHRSGLCVRKTVRMIRTREDLLPYELYNNLYPTTKDGIVGKPPTFFLAAFCLMKCLSQHLRERCSLKPCPSVFSLVFEMVPATPEHASLAQCPEWVSLPRRACLEAICFGGHWGLSRKLEQKVSSGMCNQVTVLACACERQSEQFAQRKICHIGFSRGFIFYL